MAPKPPPFPGFTLISERIYFRNGHEKTISLLAHDPTRIAILDRVTAYQSMCRKMPEATMISSLALRLLSCYPVHYKYQP